MKNNILINTATRNIKTKDYDFLGVAGENDIEQLVFKLTAFIEGTAILEIEKYNTSNEKEKYFITLEQQEESYVLDVKNSLLDVDKEIKMQLHITTENTEVFKSKVFAMRVYEAINATETIPDEYSTWIDTANATIAQIKSLESEVETAEEERKKSETARITAETQRQSNEETRISNEEERQANEIVRQEDEQIRIANENTRNSNEEERQTNENTRQTNEQTRIENEEIRLTNETERQTAETKRAEDTTNAINNIKNLNEAYEQLAEEKTAELNEIAEGVKDTATAIQFATFEVDDDMNLLINTADKLKNTSFTFVDETGELEVEIVNE